MQLIYKKKIEYGMCDTNAKLKIPEILKMVEAGVASYFGLYHKDNIQIKKDYHALWLFTKTAFQIDRLPCWDETVLIEACRVAYPSKLSCIVEIKIHTENGKGITAWVECLVADMNTRKLLRLQAIDFTVFEEKPCPIEFSKWDVMCENIRSMVVTSSYLDYSRHVNNAEYLRILFDSYPLDELEKMKVSFVEIHYKSEAKEQDILNIKKKAVGKTTYFQIVKEQLVLEMMMKEEYYDFWKICK